MVLGWYGLRACAVSGAFSLCVGRVTHTGTRVMRRAVTGLFARFVRGFECFGRGDLELGSGGSQRTGFDPVCVAIRVVF